MRTKGILVFLVLLALAGAGGFVFFKKSANPAQVTTPTHPSTQERSTAPEKTPPAPATSKDYFFPLSDYFSRIYVKKFGQKVLASDKFNVPCGAEFSGFHDGDDLEATQSELNTDVIVYAAAAGKVLQVGQVSGYGGLLVQSAKLASDDVTIYYGHLNYQTAKVKTGEEVSAGEPIATLGKGCSSETDGERKHLHFAIHKGTEIDVRGYVPSESVLSNWINPGEKLSALDAS